MNTYIYIYFFQITFICMVAIGIRDDQTRSDLHRNFIAPFTTPSTSRPFNHKNHILDLEIHSNIINDTLDDVKIKQNQKSKWKFEEYKIEEWDRWKEIPFHLNEGEDTSKYFRYKLLPLASTYS